MDPLRLLQEDLKDEDQEEAVAGCNRLPIIAMALGPARTREELVPFLLEYSETDNDEAQAAIATSLGDFSEVSRARLVSVYCATEGLLSFPFVCAACRGKQSRANPAPSFGEIVRRRRVCCAQCSKCIARKTCVAAFKE